MQPLDYRGLGRWNFIPLLACLVLGSTVAAFAMGIVAISILTFGVGAIATAGMIGTAAMILGPILGCIGGTWGALRSKARALNAMRAEQFPATHPLAELTSHLASKIGMPPPEVYFYDDPSVNAFATGAFAQNSAVVLSRGLLEKVNREELVAIIGHELGHIASGDIWKMNFAISFQNSVVCLFRMFGLGGFAKWAFAFFGEAAVMALSRRREYWADAIGTILGGSEAMTSALKTVHNAPSGSDRRSKRLHRSMLHWRGGGLLFSSHPMLGQRLNAIADGHFASRSYAKLVHSAPTAQVIHTETARPFNWPAFGSVFELKRLAQCIGAIVALLIAGGIELAYFNPGGNEPVLVAEPKVVPRIAGWEQREEPSTSPQQQRDTPPQEEAKIDSLTSRRDEILSMIAQAEKKRYPKEARFEPDDHSGDGELSPYQGLVEAGTSCFYQAKNDDLNHEHREDAGPDKSDLLVYTMKATDFLSEVALGVVGASVTSCWKTNGGRQLEPRMFERVKLPYDVWILTDAASGATAECGIWPTARAAKNGRVAIGAYCR